jgi:O-antigen/teichoic acid export membrane protein
MSVSHDFYEHKTDDKSIWRRFRRNVSISAFGSGLSLAIKFGQTALLTLVLSIEDFGRVLIVLSLFVFLDSFFGMRVSDAMFRFFPSFKERGEERSLKGLLLLCLALCLISGLLSYGLVFFLSPRLADRFYPNLGLAPLFRIYGCTILLTSFSGVYEPILRLHDRFSSVVAPQVVGGIVTVVLLCVYFARQPTYNLEVVAAVFTIGVFIQTVPPLLRAIWLVRQFFSRPNVYESMRALNKHRSALTKTLLNSNLSGYLKLAISPGDVFLLGLFSIPTQLAWYGLAKQLTAPLAFLQTNIQTAVIPEIAALVGKQKFAQLKGLLVRYLVRTLAISSVLLICVILLGYLLIVTFLPAEYAAALPVFYLLSVAAWLLLVLLVFRPLALSLDQLKWHNLALFASTCVVVIVILAGRMSAMTMAFIQLADALILRSLFSAVVWARVKRLANRQ